MTDDRLQVLLKDLEHRPQPSEEFSERLFERISVELAQERRTTAPGLATARRLRRGLATAIGVAAAVALVALVVVPGDERGDGDSRVTTRPDVVEDVETDDRLVENPAAERSGQSVGGANHGSGFGTGPGSASKKSGRTAGPGAQPDSPRSGVEESRRTGSWPGADRSGRPHEEWVTFSSNRDGGWGVWAMRSDGVGLHRVFGESEEQVDPQWSPDGTLLMFGDGDALVVVGPHENSRRRVVTSKPGARFTWTSWSPDGRHAVVTVCPTRADCPGELWLVDIATGVTRFLTVGHQPAWHPSGKTLVYVEGVSSCRGGTRAADGTIFSTNYCNGPIRTYDLATGTETALGESGGHPAYSPDGTRIVWQKTWGAYEMAVVVAPVRAPSEWRRAGTGEHPYDFMPSWTPDGRIIFNRMLETHRDMQIWVMNPDGTGARMLNPVASVGYNLMPKMTFRSVR